MKVYAAYNIDKEVRKKSSSGGVFSLLAAEFDVVYGVGLDEDCYGASLIRTEGDFSILRGSKYLQAKIGNAFINARKDLDEGKTVLFSGTGCQIGGFKAFLGKEYDNLFCLDVVCHGVPSQALWKKYVVYQEKKNGKITKVNFRCKDYGWKSFGMKENDIYYSKDKDLYMVLFLRNYCLRPSCYTCQFKENKLSDLTIGDFWGIENVDSGFDDGFGTSLVITRTEKGQKIFDLICNKLHCKEVEYDQAVEKNRMEYESAKRPIQRSSFYKDLNRYSMQRIAKIYLHPDFSIRAKRKLQRILRDRNFFGNGEHPSRSKNVVGYFNRTDLDDYDKAKHQYQIIKGETKDIPCLYSRKEDCCGCGACFSVCPKSAIIMKEDEEGFDYPVIDSDACIRCLKCLNVCPVKIT